MIRCVKFLLLPLLGILLGCANSLPREGEVPVNYTCDFDFHSYLTKPQGFKYESLGGALAWINKKVYGQLTKSHGKNLYKQVEEEYWVEVMPDRRYLTIRGISQNITYDGVPYLMIYERVNNNRKFTMVKVSVAEVERFKIQPDKIRTLFSRSC